MTKKPTKNSKVMVGLLEADYQCFKCNAELEFESFKIRPQEERKRLADEANKKLKIKGIKRVFSWLYAKADEFDFIYDKDIEYWRCPNPACNRHYRILKNKEKWYVAKPKHQGQPANN